MENLQGKCVLLGITGGIAAYKMANVASGLRKAGATVHVIMTENATKFITPLTFETLTNNRCVVDTFARDFQYDVKHISLAKAADLILIAPATANVIAKLANGLADDMLTTTVLAARCKKLVAPAMNTEYLICEGIEIRQGKKVSLYEANIYDDKGQLVDKARFSFYMMNRSVVE